MFVGDDVLLNVGFAAAQARFAELCRGGALLAASKDAYGGGITDLARVGPVGPVEGLSRLVGVHVRDLAISDDCARAALRWEAIGPGGGLFPAMDANIALTAAGKQATTLTLAGSYRPPLGAVIDRAILHRVATATIRAFLNRVADAIARPPAGVA